jgi:asparagine synthase (glutamine-hydrolysing)
LAVRAGPTRICASGAETEGHRCRRARRLAQIRQRHAAGHARNFALVLIDTRQRCALLAIDRTGIERLCFARVGGALVFSTSARAVARHPLTAAAVNPQALYEYLYCHMVPSPDTAFSGVEKLLPAECATFTGSTRQSAPSTGNWLTMRGGGANDAMLRQRFLDLTEQAVARQYDARQPTGAFLSGGTDSSTVSGMLGKVAGVPAKTFSIGFEAEGFDELEYARLTARHFGTETNEYYVTADDLIEAMPLIAAAYDEPFGNASARTHLLLRKDGARAGYRGGARRGRRRRILRRQ